MTVTLSRTALDLASSTVEPHRRRSLDGLRGIAAVLVVLGHSHLDSFSMGFLGVDVFFVLSGYLITTLLLRRPVSYRSFLARRAARLVPALVTALAIIALQQIALGSFDGHCAALSLTHTMDVSGLGATACAGPWHVTWSLAFEEQFYVLWPLVLVLVLRRSRRLVGGVLVLIWLANATRMVVLTAGGMVTSNDRLLYDPDGRALSILLGCAVAMLCADASASRWLARHRRLAPVPIGFGLALLIVPLFPYVKDESWRHLVVQIGGDVTLTSVVGLGASLLVFGLVWSGEQGRVARLLAVRPLVAAGAISYSLYLLHLVPITLARAWFPGRTLLAAIIGTALAVLMAALSRRLVERPFQRMLTA